MKTIGQNIVGYRKEKRITQEQLAEICGVSAQAVSKWENDVSCPDVTLLKTIARTFGVSVDALLDDGEGPITSFSENGGTKGKILKIRAVDHSDKVSINLPVALVEILLKNDELKNSISIGGRSNALGAVDLKQVMELVSLGVAGKLIEMESEEGELVEVWVE